MTYEVIDNKFIAIKGINHIKKTNIEMGEYDVKNNTINGYLLIDVTYVDNDEQENIFHSKMPIQIFVEEEKCSLEINDSSVNVVDNQGIEVLFSLLVKGNEEIIKEEIIEEIDTKLEEALKKRDDSFLDDREIAPVIIEEDDREIAPVIIEEKEELIMPNFKEKFKTYKLLYQSFNEVSLEYELEDIVKEEKDYVIIQTNE